MSIFKKVMDFVDKLCGEPKKLTEKEKEDLATALMLESKAQYLPELNNPELFKLMKTEDMWDRKY